MSIQQYEQTAAVTPIRPDTAPVVHNAQVTDLVQWAEQAQAAYRVGEMICNTEFCPAQYKGKPEKAAAAMLAGAELGFSPMTALNAFDVIQGATSLKARTMRAIVQSRGHYIKTLVLSPERVVMEGHRKGQPEQLETVEWTIERAQIAGYVDKNKANYTGKPQEMLTARCTGELCRLIAADALLGIPYTTEELLDDPTLREPSPDEKQAALPAPRAARRGNTTVSAADLTGATTVDAPATGAEPEQPAGIDRDQWTAITAHFKAANVAGPDRGVIVDRIVGREVGGMANLTYDEAATLEQRLSELGASGIKPGTLPADEAPIEAEYVEHTETPGYVEDPDGDAEWAAQVGGDQ